MASASFFHLLLESLLHSARTHFSTSDQLRTRRARGGLVFFYAPIARNGSLATLIDCNLFNFVRNNSVQIFPEIEFVAFVGDAI